MKLKKKNIKQNEIFKKNSISPNVIKNIIIMDEIN